MELEEVTMEDIIMWFAILVQYDRILSKAGYKYDVSIVVPKPKVDVSLCAQYIWWVLELIIQHMT